MRCLSTTWLLNIIRLVNENIPYYGDVFIMCPLKGLFIINSDCRKFWPRKIPSPTGVNHYEYDYPR